MPPRSASHEFDNRPEVFRLGESIPITPVRMDGYVVCAQMRPRIVDDRQRELVHSLETADQMYGPILLARADEELARRYIRYTNELWGKRKKIRQDQVSPDGKVLVLAAGHRRDRATEEIAKKRGYGRTDTEIDARIFPCSVMDDIIKLQVHENFHDRPPALQYAIAIREMFYIGWREGRYETVADFLSSSPLNEKTTHEALSYFSLSADVQKLVEDDELSYSLATELVSFQRAVKDYFISQAADPRESILLKEKEDIEGVERPKLKNSKASTTDQIAGDEGPEGPDPVAPHSRDELADIVDLANFVAEDRVKTVAMFVANKMKPHLSTENIEGIRKEKPWSATKSRNHIRGLARDLRTSQMEWIAFMEGAVERASIAAKEGSKTRKGIVGQAAIEAIMSGKTLAEIGTGAPINERTKRGLELIATILEPHVVRDITEGVSMATVTEAVRLADTSDGRDSLFSN